MPEFITLTLGGQRSGKIIINPDDIVCVSDGLYPPVGYAPTNLRDINLRGVGVVRVEESMSEIMMELGIDEDEECCLDIEPYSFEEMARDAAESIRKMANKIKPPTEEQEE